MGECEGTAIINSGTRTLDYAVDSQLIADHLAFGTSLFTLHEKSDTLGRNAGYALSNEVDQVTGAMQSFDLYGRLNQVAVDGISGAFTYSYFEGSHLQKSLAMPNGVTRNFGYEQNRDLLTLIVHSNATERLVQRDFTYDGLARLQNRTLFRANETPVQPDAFGYNIRSEITNAVIGANAYAYDFDPIGNRLAATEFGTNTVYTASALNQYTSINPINPVENFTPEFDLDGNQILLRTTTGIWHVTYNAENRPILFSNQTTVVEMAYDYMGRRFAYKENDSGTLTRHERYLYRGYLQIAVLDMLNSANVKHSIVWDTTEPTATRPLVLQIGTTTYYYSLDQVKNVTELFDSTGALVSTYDYSPFGQVVSCSGTIANPLTFSSEVHDSSLGLQYYNYRHLNVLDGRWVNRDPIGEDGGFSIYSFADNRVVYRFDHLGLWSNLRREKNMRYWLVRADADGESIESLLDLLKGTKLHLDGTRAFGDDGWLRKKNENGYASNISGLADIKKGCVYVGPNTAYLTYGDRFPGSYARFSLMPWTKIAAGQIADELEKNKFFVADRAISLDTNTPEFGMDLASINSLLMNNDVAAWAHVGHGKDLSGELLLFDKGAKTSIGHGPNEFTPKWKLSYVILWSCFAGRLDWTPLVAPKGGKVFASKDLLFNGVDMPFRMNMNLNGGTRIQWNPI